MAKGNRTRKYGAENSRFIDLKGKRFGMLTVIEYKPMPKRSKWLCKCDCGNYTLVTSGCLRKYHTRSCGCLREMSPDERDEVGMFPTQGKRAVDVSVYR